MGITSADMLLGPNMITLRGLYSSQDVQGLWEEYGVDAVKIADEATIQRLLSYYEELGDLQGTLGNGTSQKLNVGRSHGAPFSKFAMRPWKVLQVRRNKP